MAVSLALIILIGLLANVVFSKIKMPGLLGMLLTGIIIGPFLLNLISDDMIKASADFREIALIVILLRAGFEISSKTIRKVGKTALLMSCIPALFEGAAITIFAPYLLNISYLEAAILGSIIAAVSPAVVVPYMIDFIQRGKGSEKDIPSLIIAASSVDDIFVIVIFSSLLGLYFGNNVNIALQLMEIPVSIVLGVAAGAVLGIILCKLFKSYHMRDTKKVLIILGISILLTWAENLLKNIIPFSSLLGVMTIGAVILEKYEVLAGRLSQKFSKIWVFAEILLFVLVGAQVDIRVAFNAGLSGVIVILMGLIWRSIGVYICLLGSGLNFKEKLFCIVSYIPKATVQAAIGAIPLSAGVKSGDLILAVAVMSIIITAPLGAIGIKYFGEKYL